MSDIDVPNAPRVFRLYPSDEDRLHILSLFEAQKRTHVAVMREARRIGPNAVTNDECFDRVVTSELLESLSAFGDVAVSVLHDTVDFAVDHYRYNVERGVPEDDEDEYLHTEWGFTVPAYYLSFFFDESTSIGFGEIGPMPTSLDYNATDSISELIVLSNEESASNETFEGVLIERDGTWS